MPVNGTYSTVLSDVDAKGKAKTSVFVSALADANTSAKKADPKNGKKVKK